ncbi:MAG TPA: DUF4139 domain-containing protein [Acidobacteriaceae bacterium]|nr:DUF4139 domain-containing protein [Acidobacteriaceae bacterium]
MRFTPLVALLLVVPALAAQKTPPAYVTKTGAIHPAPDKPASLPVTRVSLYKNGVGYFEHTGHVTGDADVSIDFTTSQLNDVLQSLTAIDLNGGRISGAGYNSTTPLDQQLKALPLALGEDTTAADFYAAIRGARVEVHAPGAEITGRLLSVEDRNTPTKDGDTTKAIEQHFLTVVSDAGEVRTLELTQSTSVRLLDTDLHQDVTRYLQLLAGNRSQGLRHLTLTDRGTGSRELHVSYISEVPIWKSTYRILFTDSTNAANHTATLQGWAVVDNTVGEDWTNVQLSLIAGAPQSFIQPLSDPIYSRRPEIPIAQEAQLTPQTFDSSNEDKTLNNLTSTEAVTVAASAPAMSVAHGRVSAGIMAGYGSGSGSGIGTGSGGNTGSGAMFVNGAPMSYQAAAASSLTVNTQTAAFDDFFEYKISQPITIRKNESALVPILQSKIDADRVTLVSSNGYNTTQPLRALWIKNTTGLTLDRGSFALIENGNFGGEGLFDPIHADERRLLSYAADQAVHVSTEGNKNISRITLISAAKGVLSIHRAEVREITYVIHNSAADRRTIVIEYPVQQGFRLESDTKPEETTPTVYRFRVEAAPGETVRLPIGLKHNEINGYQLTHSDDNQLTYILNNSDHNAALEAALKPIFDVRRKVADAQTAVDQTNAKLTNLRGEEERQRANITALNAADKGSRDRFVHDLNATEDEIKAAQTELTTRTTALEAAKADLATAIDNFSINEKP